jgi:hypothetical protein
MENQNPPPPSRKMWAYGYEISPPMTQERLKAIEHFLDEEHAEAKRQTRTWQGRFIVEEQVTHIMVVSDSSDQKSEVNRRLEAELTRLEAMYSLTPAMPLHDGEDPPFVLPGVVLDA